jgi:hypothetical protein
MASGPRCRPSGGLSEPPVRTRHQTARVATQRTTAQPDQAPLPAPFAGLAHVDVGRPQHRAAPEHGAGAGRRGRGERPVAVRLVLTDPCMPARPLMSRLRASAGPRHPS